MKLMSASTITPMFTYSHSRLISRTSKYAITKRKSRRDRISKRHQNNYQKGRYGNSGVFKIYEFSSSLNISTPTITSIGYIAFEGISFKKRQHKNRKYET